MDDKHKQWPSLCADVCVGDVRPAGRVRACARWYLYAATWKHKLKVCYLFFSLIAEITVYFQTAVRCGELAWLSEHTQRTEGASWREGVGGINGRWVGAEECSSFLSEDSFQRIITKIEIQRPKEIVSCLFFHTLKMLMTSHGST